MEFQTRFVHSHNKENRNTQDVARRLRKIKRRILQDIENEGGSPQNNWRADESRSPPNNYVAPLLVDDRD